MCLKLTSIILRGELTSTQCVIQLIDSIAGYFILIEARGSDHYIAHLRHIWANLKPIV